MLVFMALISSKACPPLHTTTHVQRRLISAGLDGDEPTEPNLKLIEINLFGVIHTAKLAAFYFNRQEGDARDKCLILVTSIMGYIDTQGSSLYGASKHAVRGLMCCLRRKGVLRVNALAPWYLYNNAVNFADYLTNLPTGSL